MSDDRTTGLLAEVSRLEADRQILDGIWQELAEICMPRKQITRTTLGQPDIATLEENIDITAQQANLTLAAGQMAHITPMGSQEWFRLEPPEHLANNAAAIRWYGELTVTIRKALANSNFYNEVHECYLDRGCFGISALEIRTGPRGMGVWFGAWNVGSFSIAEDEFGRVTSIARRYKLTAGQAVEQFPKAKNMLPEEILTAYDIGDTKKFEFVHYIRPNRRHRPDSPFSKKYESFDICLAGDKCLVAESGYHEFPVAVSRWQKIGDSAYGWGPALLALPPARQANHIEVLTDHLGELQAYPRFILPAGMKGEIDLRPGGATYYDASMGGESPREWLTGGRADVLQAQSERKRQVIEAAFFVPLFQLITQEEKQMTAFEVQQRVSEKGALFHPIFVRAVYELLTPTIMRTYALLARQPGALPTPPADVLTRGEGGGLELQDPLVSYVSPLALAITQSQNSGLPNVLNTLALLAPTNPEVYDSVAIEEIYPTLARAYGIPEKLIRTPEQMAEIAAAKQQAQQMAQMEQMAGAAGKLGGADGLEKIGNMMQ